MISEISVNNFKRFNSRTLRFCSATLLTGKNGAGKTSLIQAILLVRQSCLFHNGIVELNGPFGLELGYFNNLVNFDSLDETFNISFADRNGAKANWTFRPGDTEFSASVSSTESYYGTFSVTSSEPRLFHYLSAERRGPRLTQRASALPRNSLGVGHDGRYTGHVLAQLGSEGIHEKRLADSSFPPLLKFQVERWLYRIVGPVEVDVRNFPGTDVVSMYFRTGGGEWISSTNMGFGISYVLPIIVAGLIASAGAFLIIENPEAHLHPFAQSEIGIFLATIAAAGVQILVETHSDHVINGFRKAIGVEHVLGNQNAIVHYFADKDSEYSELAFTEAGGISNWPVGFFDQYQMDITKITRARRR